jgi:hypothetical protein
MPVVLRCLELVGTVAFPEGPEPRGKYLASYDPEAHDGRGDITWCDEATAALRFADTRAALAALFAVPRRRPRRRDGKPNRPLMAFTMQTVPLEEP